MERGEEMIPKIILCGKTGVGKSTLVNSVLGEMCAEEGVGSSITKGVNKYQGNAIDFNSEFCLYDTEGFVLNEKNREESLEEVKNIIKSCLNEGEDSFVHGIWYCINVMSSRIENKEYEIINEIANEFNVKIFIVLTQAIDEKRVKELMESIYNDNVTLQLINTGKIIGVMPVLARRYQIDGENFVERKGIYELVSKTFPIVKESTVNAYVQKIGIMKEKAKKYSSGYIATTLVSAASPIPFSDAALLIPLQVGMLIHINKIFEIKIAENTLKKLASMVIGVGGATVVGKTIVSNLLKFIPGIGTIAGGAISATVAGSLTTALAKAYIDQARQYKLYNLYKLYATEDVFINNVFSDMKSRFSRKAFW